MAERRGFINGFFKYVIAIKTSYCLLTGARAGRSLYRYGKALLMSVAFNDGYYGIVTA